MTTDERRVSWHLLFIYNLRNARPLQTNDLITPEWRRENASIQTTSPEFQSGRLLTGKVDSTTSGKIRHKHVLHKSLRSIDKETVNIIRCQQVISDMKHNISSCRITPQGSLIFDQRQWRPFHLMSRSAKIKMQQTRTVGSTLGRCDGKKKLVKWKEKRKRKYQETQVARSLVCQPASRRSASYRSWSSSADPNCNHVPFSR